MNSPTPPFTRELELLETGELGTVIDQRMAALTEATPAARVTFNFVPGLWDQLDAAAIEESGEEQFINARRQRRRGCVRQNGFAAEDEAFGVGNDGPLTFEAALTSPEAGRTRIDYVLRQTEKRLAGEAKARYLDAAGRYLDARRGMFILRPVEDAAEGSAEDADAEADAATAGQP